MTATPDHLRILALARAALQARDDQKLWGRSATEACDRHGAACDALWEELERQVVAGDGGIPVLEHPSVKQRRIARQLRTEIIAAVQASVIEALEDIADGIYDWEDDE